MSLRTAENSWMCTRSESGRPSQIGRCHGDGPGLIVSIEFPPEMQVRIMQMRLLLLAER
jgi:hypothetical protein